MKTFLREILADPVTQSSLGLDEQIHKLISKDTRASYEIRDEVPVLLPRRYENIPSPSPLHKDTQTKFDYIDHYRKDAEFFDYFREPQSKEDKHEVRRLHEAILNELPSATNRVLDVGCGRGWVAQALCPKGKEVISMDISTRNAIETLKRVPEDTHAAMVGDVYHIPLQTDSVDAVIASEVMEHTPDPKLFLGQLLRVVRPGGKILITTPYNEEIKYHLCVHCNRPTPGHAHLHSFNENNIHEYLPESNLEWNYRIFSNRYLHKLRSHLFLNPFSFNTWRRIDRIFNKILFNPSRFMISIVG